MNVKDRRIRSNKRGTKNKLATCVRSAQLSLCYLQIKTQKVIFNGCTKWRGIGLGPFERNVNGAFIKDKKMVEPIGGGETATQSTVH